MTDRYAVIGNPIGHSKSPLIHRAFAQQTGQELEYTAIEAPEGGFAAAVDAFRHKGARGLNITAPFKLDAFSYATKLLDRARLAGATNAMSFVGDVVEADNFDGVGLLRDIEYNQGIPLQGKRVLLLGSGGAARGALLPFLEARPAELVIINRTFEKARSLAEAFGSYGSVIASGYDRLKDAERYDVVINATSASLRGEALPVSANLFSNASLAYELAYGKGLTPFLRLARESGVARVCDGVGMLVEQAAEAFAWWRGVRPATAEVIAKLTVPLT
ncbi:shikimate dehydrogenase [Bradyrhizobium sp. AZCC 2262]|jgi:shikimate dehydrogenase|uniref:shikimate dehydrogenase n=1 Tax=Bradyrhizobium sp. AZCC 2262 TaxID=3117022 RepID=UPI002FF04413